MKKMFKKVTGFAVAFVMVICAIAPTPAFAAQPAAITQVTQLNTIASGEAGQVTFEFTGTGVADGNYVVHLSSFSDWDNSDGLSLYGTQTVSVFNPWFDEYEDRAQLIINVSGGAGQFTLRTDGTAPSMEITFFLYYANESRLFEDASGIANFTVSGNLGTNINTTGASPWAQEGLTQAISLGLVPTSLQSNYTEPTTRAEFAALAVALYENQRGTITGRVSFADTTDINVQKAAYIGVVTGVGDNQFAPNATLTREQAAVMLSRLATAIGTPLPAAAPTFADNNTISPWAIDGVGQMQSSGIMGGVGDNRFNPIGLYTREQSIVTIIRLLDYIS